MGDRRTERRRRKAWSESVDAHQQDEAPRGISPGAGRAAAGERNRRRPAGITQVARRADARQTSLLTSHQASTARRGLPCAGGQATRGRPQECMRMARNVASGRSIAASCAFSRDVLDKRFGWHRHCPNRLPEEAMESEIRVYGADWRGLTRRLREYLTNARFDYDYFDVDRDDIAQRFVRAGNDGRRRFSLVGAEEQVLLQPTIAVLQHVLHEHAISPRSRQPYLRSAR